MQSSLPRTRFVLLLALGAAAACAEPSAPDASPRQLVSIAAGDAQEGSIAMALPDSPTVMVVDRRGEPQAGVAVEWRVIEGGGSVSEPFTQTGADGRARVAWTLGEDAGRQLLLASVRGSPSVTFRADAAVHFLGVAAGLRHTCGLDALGNAFCWGEDRWGQLGNGSAGGGSQPTRVAGGYRFERVQAGWQHTCGLGTEGEVLCWGENGHGQLGDGTQTLRPAPVEASGGRRYTSVSTGGVHSCAVASDGTLWCWGGNGSGQLGVASGTCTIGTLVVACARTPVQVALPEAVTEVAAGFSHTCARLASGRIHCWGSNDWGESGVGRFGGTVPRPEPLAGPHLFRSLAAGLLNTCGVASTGKAYCWGMTRGGVLGTGITLNYAAPEQIASDESFRTVQLGESHACGLAESGELYCWGALTGDPAVAFARTPLRVPGDLTFQSLSVGGAHTCATNRSGLWCWGANAEGQLGLANGGARVERPTRVAYTLPGAS